MTVPGQHEITAAWHTLSPEARDRIGIIAVDMVFQAFVHGDGYAPEDRSVAADTPEADAVRGRAALACDDRLTELHHAVEDALPDLFGLAGKNPAWAVAMGARP